MVKIRRTSDYEGMLGKLLEGNGDMLELVRIQAKIFRKNPKDTRLDNHSLHKGMDGKWAFSVTDDIRILYEWLGANTARFLAIGSHEEVYKKSS